MRGQHFRYNRPDLIESSSKYIASNFEACGQEWREMVIAHDHVTELKEKVEIYLARHREEQKSESEKITDDN